MRRTALWCVLLALVAGLAGATGTAASAATAVCALYCDTADPSRAAQEAFPVPDVNVNGRLLRLHVDDADGMAWASIDRAVPSDSVWIDRSWDGGATWDGLLGKAAVPGSWTGTRTLMYNLYDPAGHRRAVLRACGDAQGVACTSWARTTVCAAACDGGGTAAGDSRPVPQTTLSGRAIALHTDDSGMAWATLSAGTAGDEVWLDRSWNSGASWPDGSSLGRTAVPAGATGTRTARFNTSDPLGRLYGGAVRACGRAVEGQSGSCTAWARPAAGRAAAAADALMYSYDPNTAYWPSSWWNSAVALTTVVDYMRKTGDTRYAWIVNRTYQVDKAAFPAGARSSDPIDGDFISRATDDAEWWALAWIDAYDLTRDATYLNEAVVIANYVNGLWDTGSCGGGVWWDRERTYKNAVTNALWVRITAALHNRIPGDTQWLGRATTAWTWFQHSGLINSAGLVNDGLTASCANNGQTVWSYNQGLSIGGAVEIWRATGDAAALGTARRLADAALASPSLVSGGVLTESCDAVSASCDDNAKQFKGVFMRYLDELDTATGGAYAAFARTQADSVWNADRDSLVRLGERWAGADPAAHPNTRDWRTQASALSALLAAP
ncbi:glycoside hydrolase family 76 protein [Actinacidiphila paucisporea]|uniref:Predicted alpha-1,6-mannanase, GH76 family n=1 Tax=Actinacidiphila paucisporea TaxID=310782 RepID=A0A1M7MY86_9ACTN|nr:glycoside hydrolase family 76 protein [Actinacidiphila paucisporea]SHM96000.1 Predicted alpha-1,6-mannanase, GH76 family [Actinacidiphila paucisporea]